MALAQSSSLMTLGLKGDRSMARHNSVPSLGSKVVEFNFGRPNYAVSTHGSVVGSTSQPDTTWFFRGVERTPEVLA